MSLTVVTVYATRVSMVSSLPVPVRRIIPAFVPRTPVSLARSLLFAVQCELCWNPYRIDRCDNHRNIRGQFSCTSAVVG
jgi:hypothetical protein